MTSFFSWLLTGNWLSQTEVPVSTNVDPGINPSNFSKVMKTSPYFHRQGFCLIRGQQGGIKWFISLLSYKGIPFLNRGWSLGGPFCCITVVIPHSRVNTTGCKQLECAQASCPSLRRSVGPIPGRRTAQFGSSFEAALWVALEGNHKDTDPFCESSIFEITFFRFLKQMITPAGKKS